MNKLRLRLIYEEALQRLRDADVLSDAQALSESTDSSYLLRLLGLELLLKFVHESILLSPGRGHEYEKLFSRLPADMQSRLLSLAGERIGPSGLASNHDLILREWGQNFIVLRYPWERYEGMSEEGYSRLSGEWVANGAQLENAKLRYYPEELVGLLAALRIVASELADHASLHRPSDASPRH